MRIFCTCRCSTEIGSCRAVGFPIGLCRRRLISSLISLGYAFLRLFNSSQDWTAIGAEILLPTSIALIAMYLARQAGSLLTSLQTLAWLSLCLLAYARGWPGADGGILLFSCHGGQVAVTLVCFALLLKPTARRVAGAAVLAFLTALSDPLFVMAALAPMVLLVWSFAPAGPGRWLKIAALLAANHFGLAARARLPVPPQQGHLIDVGRSANALHAFTAHLGDANAYPVRLGLALAVVAIVVRWRDANRRAIVLALVLSILTTFLGAGDPKAITSPNHASITRRSPPSLTQPQPGCQLGAAVSDHQRSSESLA